MTKVLLSIPSKNWPSITYEGMIKNQTSSRQLALLIINGESHFMKIDDQINGVEVLKIYKDSVQVVFEKIKRMIKK